MSLLKKIEQLSQNCLFLDNREVFLEGLNEEMKTLFLQGDQLKLREMISTHQVFADSIEVVKIHD